MATLKKIKKIKITSKKSRGKKILAQSENTLPSLPPTLCVMPLGKDTNFHGDIFGGWLMSQIDLAGFVVAAKSAKGPVATIAVKELIFKAPIFVGDIVSLYATVTKIGEKSVTTNIEVYTESAESKRPIVKAAHAEIVYVAISKPGHSRIIPKK